MIFGRKTASTTEPRTDAAPDDTTTAVRGYTPPKGRATPKRSDAQAARKTRVTAPTDKKAAAQEQRERRRVEAAKVREAMQTGDDRYLPKRDRGPVRRAVRDFVDSRVMFAELLMPIMLALLLALMLRIPIIEQYVTLTWMVVITLVLIDLLLLWVRIRRMLRKNYGTGVDTRGATLYGILRGMQLRFMRLPKPQVRVGGGPKNPDAARTSTR